jgi:hypothetical protein
VRGTLSTVDFKLAANHNKWYHIACTFNTTDGTKLYINGALDSSDSDKTTIPTNAGGVNIGYLDILGSPSRFAPVILDDVRLYNRALSAVEVQQLYGQKTGSLIKAATLLPCTPSYANHGGTGDRRPGLGLANISVTSSGSGITAMQGGGGAADSAWVNGGFNAGQGFFGTVSLDGSQWLRFDFASGNAALITEAKFYQETSDVQGTWKWQGSNDASSWVDIGGSFTLGGTPTESITTLSGNKTKYRYYQMVGLSGATTPNPWLYEMEFKICGLP